MTTLFARPIIRARNAVVTSGHYLATAAGLGVISSGGNAVDAGAAMAFCLHLLEPHQNGIGGEVPILIYSAKHEKVFAISGMGTSPAALDIEFCKANKLDMIPPDGFLPACVPAAVGTWCEALSQFGTLTLGEVLAPAIEIAEAGFPVYEALQRNLTNLEERFTARYPSSAAVYYTDGKPPKVGQLLTNPDYASMLKMLCEAEAAATGGRVEGIEAAKDCFYRGPIAEKIVKYITENPVLDKTGRKNPGLLTKEDFATRQAKVEEPLSMNFRGLDVFKCSSWTQGPVFLQQLALLDGYDLKAMGHNTADYLHTWIECAKLAFADREAYYGDPDFDNPPFDVLFSAEYAAKRRELIGEKASLEMRPGDTGSGVAEYATSFDVAGDNRKAMGLGESKFTDMENSKPCDTTQLQAIDAEGNFIVATPSGGWIPSSPVIEGLGFPLGTRAQMFYLNPARPNALEPRKRPRCTLTPSMVLRAGKPVLGFGMRGGDGQDQWTLQFFLNHVVFGMDIQEALDKPLVMIAHMPDSFYPRTACPAKVLIDRRVEKSVRDELTRRGHVLEEVTDDALATMCVHVDEKNGTLQTACRSTGQTAYAMGW